MPFAAYPSAVVYTLSRSSHFLPSCDGGGREGGERLGVYPPPQSSTILGGCVTLTSQGRGSWVPCLPAGRQSFRMRDPTAPPPISRSRFLHIEAQSLGEEVIIKLI